MFLLKHKNMFLFFFNFKIYVFTTTVQIIFTPPLEKEHQSRVLLYACLSVCVCPYAHLKNYIS